MNGEGEMGAFKRSQLKRGGGERGYQVSPCPCVHLSSMYSTSHSPVCSWTLKHSATLLQEAVNTPLTCSVCVQSSPEYRAVKPPALG